MSNIWSCQIIEQSFNIVLDSDIMIRFPFIFPFDELLLECIWWEWISELALLLLLLCCGVDNDTFWCLAVLRLSTNIGGDIVVFKTTGRSASHPCM